MLRRATALKRICDRQRVQNAITIDDAMRLQKEKYEETFLKYKEYLKEKYKSTEQQILI